MSILKAHVTAISCESPDEKGSRPRFGKFSNDPTAPFSSGIRMAGRPENFAKAGFFFSCRTPHVSKGQCLGLRGRKQGALSEGRRSQSVCEELARTGKWFDEGLAHHTGSRKKNRIATRNVVLRDGVKAGSNLLALPIV